MSQAEIKAEISEWEDFLTKQGVPDDEKDMAREQIADLKKQLAALDKPKPAATRKQPKSKPAGKPKYKAGMVFTAEGERLEIKAFESANDGENFYFIHSSHSGSDSWGEKQIARYIKEQDLKPEKIQSQADFIRDLKRQEREAKKAKRKPAEPFTGAHVDRDGHPLAVGDTVNVQVKGKMYEARLTSLRRNTNGGYGVKFSRNGKTVTAMLQPSAIQFVATGNHPEGRSATLDHMEPMPAKLVKKARAVRRADCDEPEAGILVTPTEKVTIEAPMVADPAKGDKIFAHPDGTPMAVVKGSEVGKHFKDLGDAEPEPQADGSVVFDTTPEAEAEAAEAVKDKAEKPDEKVRATQPPKDCAFLKTEDDEANPLQTFLEGMRQRWQDFKTEDKILRVLLRKSDNRVVLAIKRHNLIDFPIGTKYYSVCLNTGKMTATDKPEQGAAKVLHGEDWMKDFYRHPNANTCRRNSRELYVTCYRDGECDQAKRTSLLADINTNCRKREDEMTRSYRKYTHEKTAERWKGYKGDKSYYQIYREVIADLKAGKKV